MAKKGKQNKNTAQDDGQVYMQRLERNLAFFQRHRPALYKMLSGLDLQRVELVVTPGKDDVDMVEQGQSCYRGLAKEYSVDEAHRMLQENRGGKRILTFPPPSEKNYPQKNFASDLLKKVIAESPVAKTGFQGYLLGNFYPSVVFLGCGLGYHIEEVCKKAEIINAIIVEREPEKFAVSLYTVDWEEILSNFRKAGKTLTFAVGKAESEAQVKAVVYGQMTQDLPFYPFFSIYYNHLADIPLAKGVLDASRDLTVLATNWSNYDNELIRLVNTAHNARSGMTYLANLGRKTIPFPMAVVGSGPSIDGRIASLKKMRDRLFVVSAGTGLKPLLAEGIIPDLHVELDPSYIIYQVHEELPRDTLKKIPLLAVNEVNPLVCDLFKNVTYFFKSDNMLPRLAVSQNELFFGCNPTVTNAATALGQALGFQKIYLFGTDYGFKDKDYHHASQSIWGQKYAKPIQEREERLKTANHPTRRVFEVEGADGEAVLTRNDYYTAKRSMEDFLRKVRSGLASGLEVYNCADGAAIAHAPWMSVEEFEESLSGADGRVWDASEVLGSHQRELMEGAMDIPVARVYEEVKRECASYTRKLKKAPMRGRRDLCLLVNQLRLDAVTVSPDANSQTVRPEQFYCAQLLKGSVLHFLAVGICHGMACEDDELKGFLKTWKARFLEFLDTTPKHFKMVMLSGRTLENDPWVRRSRVDDDPDFVEA